MIGVAARALRPGKPSARGSSRRYGAVRTLAAHRDDITGPSLFELERPDSRSRVRGGPGEAIARLERRRERLLRELDSVDAALEEASAPPESFPSEGDWGAELAPDYSYLAKSAGRYTDDLPSGPPMNFLVRLLALTGSPPCRRCAAVMRATLPTNTHLRASCL